jgi:hypothetical protein
LVACIRPSLARRMQVSGDWLPGPALRPGSPDARSPSSQAPEKRPKPSFLQSQALAMQRRRPRPRARAAKMAARVQARAFPVTAAVSRHFPRLYLHLLLSPARSSSSLGGELSSASPVRSALAPLSDPRGGGPRSAVSYLLPHLSHLLFLPSQNRAHLVRHHFRSPRFSLCRIGDLLFPGELSSFSPLRSALPPLSDPRALGPSPYSLTLVFFVQDWGSFSYSEICALSDLLFLLLLR